MGNLFTSLDIEILDQVSGSKEIQISLDGDSQVLGAVSFHDTEVLQETRITQFLWI